MVLLIDCKPQLRHKTYIFLWQWGSSWLEWLIYETNMHVKFAFLHPPSPQFPTEEGSFIYPNSNLKNKRASPNVLFIKWLTTSVSWWRRVSCDLDWSEANLTQILGLKSNHLATLNLDYTHILMLESASLNHEAKLRSFILGLLRPIFYLTFLVVRFYLVDGQPCWNFRWDFFGKSAWLLVLWSWVVTLNLPFSTMACFSLCYFPADDFWESLGTFWANCDKKVGNIFFLGRMRPVFLWIVLHLILAIFYPQFLGPNK